MTDGSIAPGDFTTTAREKAVSIGRICRLEQGTMDSTATELSLLRYVFNTMATRKPQEYGWLGGYNRDPSSQQQLVNSMKTASKDAAMVQPLELKGVMPWWQHAEVTKQFSAKFDSKRSTKKKTATTAPPVSDYEADLRKLKRGELKYTSLRPPQNAVLTDPSLRALDAVVMDLQDLDRRPESTARNAIKAKKLTILAMLQNTRRKA